MVAYWVARYRAVWREKERMSGGTDEDGQQLTDGAVASVQFVAVNVHDSDFVFGVDLAELATLSAGVVALKSQSPDLGLNSFQH